MFAAAGGETLYRQQKNRPGADCSSNLELFIVKFRLKLKTVAKTVRLFSYDLNHIPYDNTVEMSNRFKGLDLVHRVPEEVWMKVHNTVQKVVTQSHYEEKEMQYGKVVV